MEASPKTSIVPKTVPRQVVCAEEDRPRLEAAVAEFERDAVSGPASRAAAYGALCCDDLGEQIDCWISAVNDEVCGWFAPVAPADTDAYLLLCAVRLRATSVGDWSSAAHFGSYLRARQPLKAVSLPSVSPSRRTLLEQFCGVFLVQAILGGGARIGPQKDPGSIRDWPGSTSVVGDLVAPVRLRLAELVSEEITRADLPQ